MMSRPPLTRPPLGQRVELTRHQEKRAPLIPADFCAGVGEVRKGAELRCGLPFWGGELIQVFVNYREVGDGEVGVPCGRER